MRFLKIIMIPMPYLFAERLCKPGLGAVLACIKFTVTQSLGVDILGHVDSQIYQGDDLL